MTNQTNLDYLFKLTAPLPERGPGSSPPSTGARPAFGDHLVQASAAAPSSPPIAHESGKSQFDKSPPETKSSASDTRPDDSHASTDSKQVEERGSKTRPTESAANDDTNTEPIHEHDLASEQSINDTGEQSSADVDSNGDENERELDAAEELAAAAVIAEGEAAKPSLEATAISDDALAQAIDVEVKQEPPLANNSSSSSDDVERQASASSTAEVTTQFVEGDDATGIPQADRDGAVQTKAQSLNLSPPPVAGEQADASSSHQVAATTSKHKHDSTTSRRQQATGHAAKSSPAAPAKNVAQNSEPKSENATKVGQRAVTESEALADKPTRRTATRATQRADATSTQDKAAAAATAANVAPVQVANSVDAGKAGEEASRSVKSVGHSSEGLHVSGGSQRAAVGAGRRAQAASTPELPRVDAARFIGRVAKAVHTAQERGGVLQLRLSPPELGSLRLELTMQNGVMTAAVETETPAARQVLLDHLPALRDRLAEQNIRIERFDVEVRQENSGGQADPRASQQEHREHPPQQSNSRHAAGRAGAKEATTNEAAPMRSRLTNSELNLLA